MHNIQWQKSEKKNTNTPIFELSFIYLTVKVSGKGQNY
jgi:hypothetical protein